jgi:hypothetical protein
MKTPITKYTERHYDFITDQPWPLLPGVMFVFHEDGKPHFVDFLCPCGCGHSVPTYLNGQHPRCWAYSPGPTLSPSIRFTGGCLAHFTITGGNVTIHEDSGK